MQTEIWNKMLTKDRLYLSVVMAHEYYKKHLTVLSKLNFKEEKL